MKRYILVSTFEREFRFEGEFTDLNEARMKLNKEFYDTANEWGVEEFQKPFEEINWNDWSTTRFTSDYGYGFTNAYLNSRNGNYDWVIMTIGEDDKSSIGKKTRDAIILDAFGHFEDNPVLKEWFNNMLEESIQQSLGAAIDEHIWALGADVHECSVMHETNCENLREFAFLLKVLKIGGDK